MVNYRFGKMEMGGTHHHLGRDHITVQSVLRDYPIAPVRMRASMHMLGAMIGLSDNLATTFMLPVKSLSMNHNVDTGGNFMTNSSGLGDLTIGLISNRQFSQSTNAAFGMSVSIPTGTINAQDLTPASSPNEMLLPYPMQLGSGSIDIKPKASISRQIGNIDFGSTISATLRSGKNESGYSLGNGLNTSLWMGFKPTSSTQTSIAFEYNRWGNISGNDSRLQQQLSKIPSADPNLRSGSELLFSPEIIVSKSNTKLGSHGIILSGSIPLWHSLEGPQLGLAWSFGLGWRFSTN